MTQMAVNWISTRAYALWEQNGRPEGKDVEHWRQAEEEYERMIKTKASSDGAEILALYERIN